MPPTLRPPLAGDQGRSASDSIGGYVFQLWHSVYAWLCLGDDDWLLLEGAEDIDSHGKEVVETHQLKREKADLSLGTKRAREVIDNFWKVTLNNPDKTILFRLVSTAGIGKEDKKPFGTIAGIDLWNLAGKTTAQFKSLTAYLEKQDLSAEVLKFLQTASISDIDQKLFRRLRWDMNQPGIEAVELAVERKLVLLGEKQGVGPDDSIAVASHLFSLVASAAASKEEGSKMLDRVLLLKEFQKQTQRMVPVSQLNSMAVLLENFGSGGEIGGARAIQSTQASLIVRRPPRTMARLVFRSKLLADIDEALTNSAIVVLQGSTGKGKTSLAAHVAGNRAIFWVDLGSFTSGKAADIGAATSRTLDALIGVVNSPDSLIVLDDLDFSSGAFEAYKKSLAALIYSLNEGNSKMLVTSQKQAPAAFTALCGSVVTASLAVPSLSKDEIVSLLELYGCSQEIRNSWGELIVGTTQGHPQLVHARVIVLQASGWPAPSIDSIVKVPTEIDETKRNAAALLGETSPEALDLLYPLSLLHRRFRKDHAVKIGEAISHLAHPGDTFDRLLGPWIESVGAGYYQLSPLLNNTANGAWSADKILATRIEIGNAILSCDNLSIIEADSILFQAIVSGANQLLIQIIPGLLMLPPEGRQQFARQASWLAYIKIEPIAGLDPKARQLVMILQLAIALAINSKSAMEMLASIKVLAGDDKLFAFWGEMNVYLGARDLTAKQGVELLVSIVEASKAEWGDSQLKDMVQLKKSKEELAARGFDPESALLSLLINRCRNRTFLWELLGELRAEPALQEIFRHAFTTSPYLASIFLNKAWLKEEKQDNPDWTAVITLLREFQAVGAEQSINALVEAAAKGTAIVQEDFLKDREAAGGTITEAIAQVGTPSPLLLDAQATFLFNGNKWEEALAIWDIILPQTSADSLAEDTVAVWGRRKAAMAAGHLGLWTKAVTYYEDAANIVDREDPRQEFLSIGLLADSAFALWQAQMKQSATARFGDLLERLASLPDSIEDLKSFKLRKSIAATMVFMSPQGKKVRPEVTELPAGFCSDPAIPKNLRELPLYHGEYLWVLLVLIGRVADYSLGMRRMISHMLDRSLYPFYRLRGFHFELECAFEEPDLLGPDFPRLCQRYATVNSLVENLPHDEDGLFVQQSEDAFIPSASNCKPEMANAILDAANIALITEGRTPYATFEIWERENSQEVLGPIITVWFNATRELFSADQSDLWTVAKSGQESSIRRLAAGILLLPTAMDLGIEDFVTIQAVIFNGIMANPFRDPLSRKILALVIPQWIKRFESRFQFRSPEANIFAIREAFTSGASDFRQFARIILAAKPATRLGLPASFEASLNSVAQKNN